MQYLSNSSETKLSLELSIFLKEIPLFGVGQRLHSVHVFDTGAVLRPPHWVNTDLSARSLLAPGLLIQTPMLRGIFSSYLVLLTASPALAHTPWDLVKKWTTRATVGCPRFSPAMKTDLETLIQLSKNGEENTQIKVDDSDATAKARNRLIELISQCESLASIEKAYGDKIDFPVLNKDPHSTGKYEIAPLLLSAVSKPSPTGSRQILLKGRDGKITSFPIHTKAVDSYV